MKLSGALAAMMTPFTPQGELNEGVIEELVDFFLAKGVSGIFPVSNVGEQIHLDDRQKKRFVELVTGRVRGAVPVLPGVSHSSPRHSAALAKMCREAGADGVVCSAPCYFSYPEEVVADSLDLIAREGGLPLVLYNIPLFANPIGAGAVERLLENPMICGIKDSGGSVATLLQLVRLAEGRRPDFAVLVGWEEMLTTALDLGAQGCMTASAGIFPEIMADICASSGRGDRARALALQKLIGKATDAMKQVFFPWGYKLAMEARGFAMGPSQVPVREEAYRERKEFIRETVSAVQAEYAGMA